MYDGIPYNNLPPWIFHGNILWPAKLSIIFNGLLLYSYDSTISLDIQLKSLNLLSTPIFLITLLTASSDALRSVEYSLFKLIVNAESTIQPSIWTP